MTLDRIKHPFSCGRLSDEGFAHQKEHMPDLPDDHRFYFFIYDGKTPSMFSDDWQELSEAAVRKYEEGRG